MFVVRFVQETDVRFNSEFVQDTGSAFEVDFVSNVAVVFHTNFIKNDLPPYYNGEYEVVPKREEQQLETKDKILSQDVVVLEVPYSETSNPAGGTTFYIAKEANE